MLLFLSVGGGNRGREAEVDLEGLSVGLKAMGCNWLEPRGGSSWSRCELGEVCSFVAGCWYPALVTGARHGEREDQKEPTKTLNLRR